PFDASSAPFANSILIKADDDSWSMISLGDPRCHDAQYSLMPTALANHDCCVACRIEMILNLLYRQVENLFFHFLSLAILPVELAREHGCLAVIVSEQ